MGLEPVIYQVGYSTTSPNRQYAYDHRYDDALYLDKAYIKRKLEVSRHAYESAYACFLFSGSKGVSPKISITAGPAIFPANCFLLS